MGRLPLLLLARIRPHTSCNSEEHTTVGSGTMGPLDLRFAHQDHTEGPLHGGAGGPWAYGPVCMKASTFSSFCLTATSHSAQLAGTWASLGSGAMGPLNQRSSSCCRTGGPGARLDQGPRGPWTGVSGTTDRIIGFYFVKHIFTEDICLGNLLLRSDQGPPSPRTFGAMDLVSALW